MSRGNSNHAGIALCVAALMALAGCRESERTDATHRALDGKLNPLDDKSTIAIFRDPQSTATLTHDPEGGIRVSYQLPPGQSWGSWVSLVVCDRTEQPLDLSEFDSVAVSIRVEQACTAATTLRLSLYDIDADGAFEWYYAADTEVLKSPTDDWVQVVFPLEKIDRAPGIWGGPVNDYKFDLTRIGKVELNLVTRGALRSEGVFLMKDLGLLKRSGDRRPNAR